MITKWCQFITITFFHVTTFSIEDNTLPYILPFQWKNIVSYFEFLLVLRELQNFTSNRIHSVNVLLKLRQLELNNHEASLWPLQNSIVLWLSLCWACMLVQSSSAWAFSLGIYITLLCLMSFSQQKILVIFCINFQDQFYTSNTCS